MAVANTAPATYLMDPTIVLKTTVGTVITSYDITDQVSSVEIMMEATLLKRTTFGNTWHRNGMGLKSGTIKIEFYLEFDAAGTFDMFNTMWASFPTVGFTVSEPGGASVAGNFVMNQMPSFAGAIDEYNVASLTFTMDGPATIVDRT